MCITRKGNPALRLLTNHGRENHLVASLVSARATLVGVKQITRTHRASQAPWDHILTPAHVATQRRGAATSRRAAGLGAYGFTKFSTGTDSSKADSDPQASKQPPRGLCRNRPEGREHGRNTYPHLRQAQPTISAYDPRPCDSCHKAMVTAPRGADGKPTACAHVPTTACTIPFSRGWTRAGPLGFRSLVHGNNYSPRPNSSYHIFRHRTCITVPLPCHTPHDTRPLGKDTWRQVRP